LVSDFIASAGPPNAASGTPGQVRLGFRWISSFHLLRTPGFLPARATFMKLLQRLVEHNNEFSRAPIRFEDARGWS
jgi:hypothetical protein